MHVVYIHINILIYVFKIKEFSLLVKKFACVWQVCTQLEKRLVLLLGVIVVFHRIIPVKDRERYFLPSTEVHHETTIERKFIAQLLVSVIFLCLMMYTPRISLPLFF